MDPSPRTVLCFGEALWDLLPSGPRLGGAPLNLACRLCGLGDRGLIVSRLGRDEHGQMAALRIAELGMDPSLLQWDSNHPTGTVEVRLDARGNPDFHILPDVAYDAIEVSYELMELAGQADCLVFGTLAQRRPTSATTLERLLGIHRGRPRFLDLNLRRNCFTWQTVERSIPQATVLKLNADEARRVAFGYDLPAEPLPDLCARLLEKPPLEVCLVTLAEKGVFAAAASGARHYEPGFAVDVVDTCGSGDAFSAGFLHAYLRGRPLPECCRLGCALGAVVATQPGATEPVPRDALEALLTGSPHRIRNATLAVFESL